MDCAYLPALQRMSAHVDYLAARAEIADLERFSKIEHQGENSESDRRAADANLEDGRRKLDRMAMAVKDVTGKAASIESCLTDLVTVGKKTLRESGKDLRVVHYFTFGLMGASGLEGLGDGFSLIDWLLETYGALVHPQPDEDDSSDESAREIVIAEMLSGAPFVRALGGCVILEAPRVGRLTVRDVEVMDGRIEDDRGGGARTAQEIRAIAQHLAEAASGPGADPDEPLDRVISRVDRCLGSVIRVTGRFSGESLGTERVTKMLQRVKLQLEAAKGGAIGTTASVAVVADTLAIAGQASPGSTVGGMVLRTRTDARKMILEISKFLEETEPSHPAPLFLKRAERLLGARDFFEIVNDMAPDSVSELKRITGHREVS